MLLWLAMACVTAGALAVILRPLGASQQPQAAEGAAEIAVYRDQLAEIDAEHERGLLGETEAGAARAEIARRLLALDETRRRSDTSASPASPQQPGPSDAGDGGAPRSPRPGAVPLTRLAFATAAAVPLLSAGLYLNVGSPTLRDQPLSTRVAASPETASLPALIASVEARLREVPDDGQGWDVIAPVYLKTGRYAEAAHAYSQASRLLGETVARLAGFAEATTLAANGIVTDEARKAYERVVRLAPERHEPRFWLALAKEQDGDIAGAAAAYKALLDAAPADAPWRAMVQERLDRTLSHLPPGTKLPPAAPSSRSATAETAGDASAPPVATPSRDSGERGPTADDIAAAAGLGAAERSAMIEQMVSGLASRLKADGRDLRGWQRLIRAYVVLGRTDDARSALEEARSRLGGDTAAQTELGLLARSLGLGS